MMRRVRERRGRARGPESSVRLYGVLSAGHADTRWSDASHDRPRDGVPRGAGRRITTPLGIAAVELLRVRDLVAAVAPAPFDEHAPTAAELDATHTIIATLFSERAILPAPPGTVFRSREAVAGWLALHAAALSEALRYVEDRVEARVHVERGSAPLPLPGAPATAPLPDLLRVLRCQAIALLVLRDETADVPRTNAAHDGDVPAGELRAGEPAAGLEGIEISEPEASATRAAFLVERAHWGAFATAVAREQDARPDLRLTLTGPWPPYDFVRLELGA